jgi:hypothetical protein
MHIPNFATYISKFGMENAQRNKNFFLAVLYLLKKSMLKLWLFDININKS